jgi:stage II sporulation protein P
VGEAVKHTLEQAGIGVIHDTTVHDDPQYSGAYSRSAETVQKNLKKHPTIRVVLDLHRDAIMEGDTGLVKPTVKVNGRKAAQMMIIAGVVSTAALPHKNWEQNLTLAARWQQALNREYPGLMRPLNTVASRYNQQLSAGYLLVEVGSEGNTLAEAVYSGQLLGKTLAELLR